MTSIDQDVDFAAVSGAAILWRKLDSPIHRLYKPLCFLDTKPPNARGEGDFLAQSPDDDSDQAALRARLDKLSKNLGGRGTVREQKPAASGGGDTGFGTAMGAGVRVVTELIAGILVGGGLGWLVDRWLNTKPLFMILIGCLGVAAGFWNIIREAMKPPGAK